MKVFSFILLFLISCQNEPLQNEIKKPMVVLCFDHYTSPAYQTPGGVANINNTGITIVDSNYQLKHFFPNEENDTLIFSCPNEFIECSFRYRNFENIYYPIYQGDTVIVTVDSLNYPILKSKHHPEYNQIYNLPYRLRKGYTHLGLESCTWLGESYFITTAQHITYIRTKGWKVMKDYCPVDSLLSLFNSYKKTYLDTISSYKSMAYMNDDIYERYLFNLQLKEHESQRILNKETTYYQRMEPTVRDSDIHHPSYHDFLNLYVQFYNRNIKSITELHKRTTNWQETFDSLAAKPFPPLSKQILLAQCIQGIGEDLSVDILNNYINKYIHITKDSLLYKQLVDKYNLSADSEQLLLKDKEGNTTTFQQILDNNKGKVIYVDFWGSWCVPCREEMKYSNQLREQYKNKDIVFIYLAYKDIEEDWHKAIKEEKLADTKYCHFILNSKNSSFLRKINLKLIPHFLLFNKDGILVEKNAPRPSNKNIIEILNNYIKP